MQRLLDNMRLFWRMASYAALGFFWVIVLQVFAIKMLPRLGYLAGRPIGNDPPCVKPECDFSDFWRAGLSVRLSPGALAHLPPLNLLPGVQMPLPGGYHEGFPYPPPMSLWTVAISHLPFEPGFFVWVGVWLVLAAAVLRWAGLSWPVVAAGLLSPAALWNIELGQMGVIGGALLVAGLLRAASSPLCAGGLLGLLACKPQIGIMVPAMLLGGRSWRGILGFAFAVLGLCLLTLALFGWPLWHDYLNGGRHGASSLLTAPFVPSLDKSTGVSVFWMMRSLQLGVAQAALVQAISSAAAMLAVCFIWRRQDLPGLDAVTLTVLLSLLATPYGYVDDMVAWSIVLVALAERRGWRIGMLDVLFWIWPMACQIVSEQTGILFTPLVVLLALAREVREGGLLQRRKAVRLA